MGAHLGSQKRRDPQLLGRQRLVRSIRIGVLLLPGAIMKQKKVSK